MLIDKIINNNVVSAKDTNHKEVIIMGKGVGFRAKKGMEIERSRIEKVFRMESIEAHDELKLLLKKLPLEHLQLSNQIIMYTKQILNKELNQNIYITLTDHINFAIERYRKNMLFDNALLWEVKRFYSREFMIGQYAVKLINQKLNIELPEDEAASIALHIVNAEYNAGMSNTIKGARMIPEILQLVKEGLRMEIDETTSYYEEFIVHLKFLIERVLKKEVCDRTDLLLSELIKKRYSKEFDCSEKISLYICEIYNFLISEEELIDLTLHIKRLKKVK